MLTLKNEKITSFIGLFVTSLIMGVIAYHSVISSPTWGNGEGQFGTVATVSGVVFSLMTFFSGLVISLVEDTRQKVIASFVFTLLVACVALTSISFANVLLISIWGQLVSLFLLSPLLGIAGNILADVLLWGVEFFEENKSKRKITSQRNEKVVTKDNVTYLRVIKK